MSTALDFGAALAAGLLAYLRERLTTEALARYILETMGQAQARNVLILSAHPAPDFLRESVVHGFRQRLGVEAVDFIQPRHLYEPRVAAPFDRLVARARVVVADEQKKCARHAAPRLDARFVALSL